MLRCLCGEHFTYRTVKAVNDDPRALMCPHVECLACDCSPYLACSCENNAYESPKAKADALWCVILHRLTFAMRASLGLHKPVSCVYRVTVISDSADPRASALLSASPAAQDCYKVNCKWAPLRAQGIGPSRPDGTGAALRTVAAAVRRGRRARRGAVPGPPRAAALRAPNRVARHDRLLHHRREHLCPHIDLARRHLSISEHADQAVINLPQLP